MQDYLNVAFQDRDGKRMMGIVLLAKPSFELALKLNRAVSVLSDGMIYCVMARSLDVKSQSQQQEP
jgi:hypothetical protein